jgi:hypothetical protein
MTPSDVRLRLVKSGFSPLPLIGKRPVLTNWQKRDETSVGDVEIWSKTFSDATNTGVLCAKMPSLDIDIVNPDAAQAIEDMVRDRFESDGGNVLVRIGKPPKRAIPFRTDQPFKKITENVIAPTGATEKIEFLCDGQQLVVAGLHPDTGQPYRWHGGEPGQVARDELPYIHEAEARQLVEDAIDLLVSEHGYQRVEPRPKPNGGGADPPGSADWSHLIANIIAGHSLHDSTRDLAAKLIRSGMSPGAAVNILRAAMEASAAPRDQRWQARYEAIPALVESARRLPRDEAPLFDPWERYIVPQFPLHVLPEVVQRYVTSQSVVIGCDPSALAMAALTAFSGALDHRFAVKMMRNGNWWEHPRLWTLLVGDPSRKKTPIINDATRPLERHQNDLRRTYEAALRDYEAAKKGKNDSVEKPAPPVRYVVFDTTTEKLGEILSRSDHGLLVKRDEFSGWIGGMEKYSGASRGAGADRGFWLQAFDGGPHAVDRIGRGETYIGNLSVSLIGGIQPARMAELHGLTSDGLLQRFVPVMMRASMLAQDCESGDDREEYQRLTYKLIRAKHQRFFMCDRALSMMNDLRAHLHELEQAAAGLADGLQAFIGKLAGLAGRLTVILHAAANPEGLPREIEATTVAHVNTLITEFILPHAVEFYRSSEELTGGERLRKIASYILTSQQAVVTSRDLTRNVSSVRGVSVFDLQTLLSPLVAAGWLEPADPGPNNRSWTVSPKVAAQFERQREIEEARKALAAKLMGSPRKFQNTNPE